MKGLVSRWSCNVLSCSASANINFEFFFLNEKFVCI